MASQANAHEHSAAHPKVDEILRRKRKARGQRACLPCRQRKVKCNYETPCKTCADRDHAELCLYQMPSKRVNFRSFTETLLPNADDGISSGAEWNLISSKIDNVEQSLQELKSDLRHLAAGYQYPFIGGESQVADWAANDLSSDVEDPGTQGIHTNDDFTGETVHLGGNSVPAMVVALGSGSDGKIIRELLGKSVLPLFGLDNQSVTYPFVDLWGLPHGSLSRIDELCKLLPIDTDCLQYFRQYRDIAHALYPGVVNIRQFESDLTQFLINRARRAANMNGEPLTEHDVYGLSLHWVGLLFAILASGCQCSRIPGEERQLTSQVYVCCAYECLRTINYLAHSSLVDIQNLLVLGNVISNNMNAGVAWSLLGGALFGKIAFSQSPAPPDGKSYTECMKSLCDIGLDIVQERSEPQDYQRELLFITERRNELAGMMNQVSHHLRDVTACRSMKDQLEHWNLYLHRSYLASELYRPTLKYNSPNSETTIFLKATCVESLADTVDAFLGLENLTRFARQSWAAVHRALSSALLLGILKEPAKNQHVRTLLDRLITVMSDLSLTLNPSEVSAPITRSISALRRLNLQEIGRVCPGRNAGINSGASWKEGDSEASTFNDSSVSNSLVPDRSDEGSPYALMDKILWGTQRESPI